MDWIINQLIAFLTELQAMSFFMKVVTLASIPGLITLLFGIPVWLMRRKVQDSVTAYEALDARLKTALKEAARLKDEVDQLAAETPETFVAGHWREMEDKNDERAMELAAVFIDRQREALLLAFRTRMDEAVRQSIEDGASAFALARSCALAALALAPHDQMLRLLIDELAAAEAVAASGARAKLKGTEDRRARAAREERLPTVLEALTMSLVAARERGHYGLMLILSEHGLTLTRRRPFGEGTPEHLLFRVFRVQALNRVERTKEALEEALPLSQDVAALFGEHAAETLSARFLLGQCRGYSGDAAGALANLESFCRFRPKSLTRGIPRC